MSSPHTVHHLWSHRRAEHTNSYLWCGSIRASPGSHAASWRPEGLAYWRISRWWHPSSPGHWWCGEVPASPRRCDPCPRNPPRKLTPGCPCSSVATEGESYLGLQHPTRWTWRFCRWQSPHWSRLWGSWWQTVRVWVCKGLLSFQQRQVRALIFSSPCCRISLRAFSPSWALMHKYLVPTEKKNNVRYTVLMIIRCDYSFSSWAYLWTHDSVKSIWRGEGEKKSKMHTHVKT